MLHSLKQGMAEGEGPARLFAFDVQKQEQKKWQRDGRI